MLACAAGAQEAASPVFELGEVVVVGARPAADDGTAARVDGERAAREFRRDVAGAAALAPGVTPARTGGRNDAAVFVRGYDLRQVPLFLDGIPVYVPYDGNADLARFDTFDLAELAIFKGYRPAICGPNTLGGAINLVSRRPTQPRELEARAGVFSGAGREVAVRVGVLQTNGYAQAGVSFRERDHMRLPGDFRPTAAEDGGARENSDSRDRRISAKLAWTDDDSDDEWALGLARQDSEKGVPPYAGTDPDIVPRFWRYTDWTKTSVYALGNRTLGASGYLKPRLYFDTYENTLAAYDDARYATQTRPSSWTSVYDDTTFGGSLEGGGDLGLCQTLRAAAHYKQDVHREHNLGRPESAFRDETVSLGAEDRLALRERWSLTLGMALEQRRSLEARDASGPTPRSFERESNSSLNPQAGLFYETDRGVGRATVARTSRFPTLKDRYSYRLGTALPNPGLDPERATHYELGYAGRFGETLAARASVFYSRLDETIQTVERVARDEAGEPWLSQLQNVGASDSRGVELGVTWTCRPELTLGGDYLYLRRENREHPEIRPTGAPEHSGRVFVEWRALSRLTVSAAMEFSSSRCATADGIMLDGFRVFDGAARVELPRGFSLTAGVRNVFDELYELDEGYPEEGRVFQFGLQCRR